MTNTSKLATLSTFIAAFLILIFYNYHSAQRAMKEEKPSIIKVENVSYPATVRYNARATFIWKVSSPSDLEASTTSIYWGDESSPSALKEYDSPQAVGYSNHPPDYESGSFRLPSEFDVSMTFDKPGTVYFRSYALVHGKHLWSEENSIRITR